MLNERLNADRMVRSELRPAEDAADESYLTALRLGVAMCEARRAAKLPIHTAAEGFDEVHAAIHHAGQTRSRLLKAHVLLADVERMILPGVSPRMFGDLGGCPPGTVSSDENAAPTLRAVG